MSNDLRQPTEAGQTVAPVTTQVLQQDPRDQLILNLQQQLAAAQSETKIRPRWIFYSLLIATLVIAGAIALARGEPQKSVVNILLAIPAILGLLTLWARASKPWTAEPGEFGIWALTLLAGIAIGSSSTAYPLLALGWDKIGFGLNKVDPLEPPVYGVDYTVTGNKLIPAKGLDAEHRLSVVTEAGKIEVPRDGMSFEDGVLEKSSIYVFDVRTRRSSSDVAVQLAEEPKTEATEPPKEEPKAEATEPPKEETKAEDPTAWVYPHATLAA